MSRLSYTWFASPVGPLLLAGSRDRLNYLSFASGRHAVAVDPDWVQEDSSFEEPVRQLRQYFAGERKVFSLPLAPAGTEFQQAVWSELHRIPYGETISYKELAQRIGKPKAVRAVGAANGANPIPIIIPCHRVVGNDGSLTGFGGGLPLKKRLLALESRQLALL